MSNGEDVFGGEGEVVVTESGETQDHVSQALIQAETEQETLPEDPDPEAPIDSEPPPETEPPVDPEPPPAE